MFEMFLGHNVENTFSVE